MRVTVHFMRQCMHGRLRRAYRLLCLGLCGMVLLTTLSLPTPTQAASGPYQAIIDELDVEVGTVTLPGAEAEGFFEPTRWEVTANDPGKVALEVLRQRYQDLIRLQDVDWDDPYVQEKVSRLNEYLGWTVAQQDLDPTSPTYGQIPGGLGIIYHLALAYHVPSSPYYHDATVVHDHIEPALEYERLHGNLHPENGIPGWWRWEISVPFRIIDILFAVGNLLSDDVRDNLENTLIWLNVWSGRDPRQGPSAPTESLFLLTEANGAWFRMISLLTGLYFRLPPLVQWAADELRWGMQVNYELAPSPLTGGWLPMYGVKPDYTMWDHVLAPNSLYGDHLFATLAFYTYLSEGSSQYGASPTNRAFLDTYFHEWMRWNEFHALEMPATRGRWPSRNEAGQLFMGAVFLLSTSSPAFQDELARVVTDWLNEHPGDLDLQMGSWGFAGPWFGNFHLPGDTLIGYPLLATAVERSQSPAPHPEGTRYYPYSEFLVVQRPGWCATFAMCSTQVPPRGLYRERDGGLLIMSDDTYSDYADLAGAGKYLYTGITAVRGEPWTGPESSYREQSPMAGAATLGDYAAAGIDLHVLVAEDKHLWARKSCFVFDDEIVCLGSGIHTDDPREVLTYLHTYPDAGHTLQTGSGWLHDGALGMIVGAGRTPVVEDATYSDVLWHHAYISHGLDPSDAAYTFAYLPMASAGQTQVYAAAPDYTVLHRGEAAHVVRDGSSGTTGAVFFQDTAGAAGHAASGAGQMLYIESQERVQSLAFYNPAPGPTTTYTISVPVLPSAWLVHAAQQAPEVHSLNVRTDGFDLTFTLERFSALVWFQQPPDFSHSAKTASAHTPREGETVTYTITIRNSGGPLTDTISVTDIVPVGVQYTPQSVAVTPATLAQPTYEGGTIHWTGVLSDVFEAHLTFAVTVTAGVPTVIENAATIDAGRAGVHTPSLLIFANGYDVYLPLVLKGG